MKPYKIIKTQHSKKKPVIINKLHAPRIPLRFFKAKKPYLKKYEIEW